jgi:hypothetical protein
MEVMRQVHGVEITEDLLELGQRQVIGFLL